MASLLSPWSTAPPNRISEEGSQEESAVSDGGEAQSARDMSCADSLISGFEKMAVAGDRSEHEEGMTVV